MIKQKTVSENGVHISAYHLIIFLGMKGNENIGLFTQIPITDLNNQGLTSIIQKRGWSWKITTVPHMGQKVGSAPISYHNYGAPLYQGAIE